MRLAAFEMDAEDAALGLGGEDAWVDLALALDSTHSQHGCLRRLGVDFWLWLFRHYIIFSRL